MKDYVMSAAVEFSCLNPKRAVKLRAEAAQVS